MSPEEHAHRQKTWPERYYAYHDHTAPQPAPVIGWLDAWEIGDRNSIPQAADLIPMTAEQWNTTPRRHRGVRDGAIIEHILPPPVVPLDVQAQRAMGWVRHEATMAAAMDETFTTEMQAYVTALRAIIAGTSELTDLPKPPTEIMAPRAA